MTDRPLPYNTGKVRIGAAYERPVRWSPSRDAYDLQTALLYGDRPILVREPWRVKLARRFSDWFFGRGV